jgi:hypothetical protein
MMSPTKENPLCSHAKIPVKGRPGVLSALFGVTRQMMQMASPCRECSAFSGAPDGDPLFRRGMAVRPAL